MVVGHNGDHGRTVQLLAILELWIGIELAQIQLHNKVESRVTVRMKNLHSVSYPTVPV